MENSKRLRYGLTSRDARIPRGGAVSLEKWIYENADKLNLKVVSYTWPRYFGLNYFDISVSMIHEKKKYIGRGTALDEQNALLKASVECIERIFCAFNKTSSNGVAAHYNKNIAKKNALNELLERDSFFCSYLTLANHPSISTDIFLNLREILESKYKILIQYFDISAYQTPKTILAVATGNKFIRPFGLCIGLGTNSNLEQAIQSSSSEIIRNITALIFDKKTKNIFQTKSPLPSVKYKAHTPITPDGHMKYINEISNLHRFENWLQNSSPRLLNPVIRSSIPKIQYTQLASPKLFNKCPLHVYKANAASLFQEAYWGKTTKRKINLKRIQEYAGCNIKFNDLNLNIHPLG